MPYLLGVTLQESRHFHAVLEVALHPEMKRFGAAIGEEAVEGGRDGAGGELDEADAIRQSRVRHRHRPHQHVRVTIHVLGARVVHDIGT